MDQSPSEEKAHFSLWYMLAAPLMAGNNLRNMSKETLTLLTNKEAIAIDQDVLGRQGYKLIDEEKNFEMFVKFSSKGDTAICFFNRGEKPGDIDINWSV